MNKCYDLAGKSDKTLQRCNSTNTAAHSACCAINKKFPDVCLDSGLCLAIGDRFMGQIYANGCTDSEGVDDACPKVCTYLQRSGATSIELFSCKPGKWCCREAWSNTDCCDDKIAEVGTSTIGNITSSMLDAIRLASVSRGAGSATNNDTAALSGDNDTTGVPTSDSITNHVCTVDHGTAPIVGGVLGGLLLTAVAGMVMAFWLWRRERMERRALLQQGQPAGLALVEPAKTMSEVNQRGPEPVEADWTHGRAELSTGT